MKQTFTTGELAKMCNVSIRTVQYYDKDTMKEINQIIEEQEVKLKELMNNEINSILNNPLPRDFEHASNDLVYVMECSIENNLIDYEKAIDMYKKILSAKKSMVKTQLSLEEVQGEIKHLTNL